MVMKAALGVVENLNDALFQWHGDGDCTPQPNGNLKGGLQLDECLCG